MLKNERCIINIIVGKQNASFINLTFGVYSVKCYIYRGV